MQQKPFKIDQLLTIKLEPGEKLVVSFPSGSIPPDQWKAIYDVLTDHFGKNVILCVGEVQFTKISPTTMKERIRKILRLN